MASLEGVPAFLEVLEVLVAFGGGGFVCGGAEPLGFWGIAEKGGELRGIVGVVRNFIPSKSLEIST